MIVKFNLIFRRFISTGVFAFLIFIFAAALAPAQTTNFQPDVRTYKTVGAAELKAHIFQPAVSSGDEKPRAAIILLHGGGWSVGSPEWTYGDAQRFASMGMVSIAGEYRLSDQKNITPLEAMADVRDLIRWVRENSSSLHIDPSRIAVYGISAGGHLAVSAAVFPHTDESKISAIPNALILLSPAVALAGDHWPQILLGTRANAREISPLENVSHPLPPMLIIEGAADTETPLKGVKAFCERAKEVGGICELHVYPNLGHILTRNLDPHAQEEGPFDADPTALADAGAKEAAFLTGLAYSR